MADVTGPVIGHKVLSARLRSHAVEDIPADVQAVIAGNMERAFKEKVPSAWINPSEEGS